jgi:uncharacterized protein (DUF2141 family)
MSTLNINIEGCRNDRGHVMVGLYSDPADFPEPRDPDAVLGAEVVIRGGRATASFEDLPAGRYAVAVIHDENDNKRMDTNLIGMPKEGFCFGNNAMRMGKPRFNDCAVPVYSDEVNISLKMHYMGLKGLR